jgi:ribosomal protein L17
MENNLEKLIKELLDEVKLLTVQVKAEALRKFNEEFLTSDLRRQMYEAFDGTRTFQQISKDIDCKSNTLQVFAQQLVDKDLADCEMKGNARILSKSLSKIAAYYASKELGE